MDWTSVGNFTPVINLFLLMVLIGLAIWRFRFVDMSKIWDEIEALKLRISVQEKAAPCNHCRQSHGASGSECDGC